MTQRDRDVTHRARAEARLGALRRSRRRRRRVGWNNSPMHDLTENEALSRARDRIARTRRPLGIGVRHLWRDRRPDLGDGMSAKVVVTDGTADFMPQTPVYVFRATSLDPSELEEELELVARQWSDATQASGRVSG